MYFSVVGTIAESILSLPPGLIGPAVALAFLLPEIRHVVPSGVLLGRSPVHIRVGPGPPGSVDSRDTVGVVLVLSESGGVGSLLGAATVTGAGVEPDVTRDGFSVLVVGLALCESGVVRGSLARLHVPVA